MTRNNELVKVQIDKDIYDEMMDALSYFSDEYYRMNTEIEYLKDFISWMNLSDSYMYFRQNAKRTFKDEDDPFGRYTL